MRSTGVSAASFKDVYPARLAEVVAAQEFKIFRLVPRTPTGRLVEKLILRGEGKWQAAAWLQGFCGLTIPVHRAVHLRREAAREFESSVIVFGGVNRNDP